MSRELSPPLGQPRRERAVAFLERTGLAGLLRRLPLWRGLIVLGYHRIGDAIGSPLDRSVFSTAAREFETQLDVLSRHFEIVGLDDLDSLFSRPRGRALLLTFDDGYRDQAQIAAPVLQSRGVSGVFFLTTSFLDRPGLAWWDELSWIVNACQRPRLPRDGRWLEAPLELGSGADVREHACLSLHARYRELPASERPAFIEHLAEIAATGRPELSETPWMSWDDARMLTARGHAVGGHSVSHPILSELDRDAQHAEIEGCLSRLRAELAGPIDSFAYPSGHPGSFDPGTVSMLREQGVRWAFSFRGGWHARPPQNAYDLRRVSVTHHQSTELLVSTVALPFLLAREAR